VSNGVPPGDRRAIIAARRRVSVQWPGVAAALAAALKPRAPAYVTGFGIEDEQEADYYWHFLLERR
jgi:hypothetical protein